MNSCKGRRLKFLAKFSIVFFLPLLKGGPYPAKLGIAGVKKAGFGIADQGDALCRRAKKQNLEYFYTTLLLNT